MDKILKAVLIDLSGTVHIGDSVIPGSVQSLNRLRSKNIKIKFVTNTTKESNKKLHSRLLKLGFAIDDNEIFSSLNAAKNLIKAEKLRPFYFLDQDAMEDFEDISTANPNAVVIGLSPVDFSYDTLNKAYRLLVDGAQLIAIHKARCYKTEDGLSLGPGAFVTGLEYSSGTKARVVGKPQKEFFHSALVEMNCKPEEAIMIGDDARDDIKGALEAGLQGILVKTGKYQKNDESKFDIAEARICNSFPDAVDLIIKEYIIE